MVQIKNNYFEIKLELFELPKKKKNLLNPKKKKFIGETKKNCKKKKKIASETNFSATMLVQLRVQAKLSWI